MSTRRHPATLVSLFALAVAGCTTLDHGKPSSSTAAPAARIDPNHDAHSGSTVRRDAIHTVSVPAIVRRVDPIVLDFDRHPLPGVTMTDPVPHPAAVRRPFRAHVETAVAASASGAPTRGTIATDAEVLYPSSSFDDNPGANDGFLFIPPDPHMAAGPGEIVTVVNGIIQFHDKATGASIALDGLSDFFASESPAGFVYDPRVVYDEFEDRWVVAALDLSDTAYGDPSNSSRVMIAVSDDADPSGTWYTTSVDTDVKIGHFDYWFDYPGLAIDEQAIYVTGNLFRFFSEPQGGSYGGARLAIVDKGVKSGLYSGATADATLLDPYVGAAFSGPTLLPATLAPSAPAGAVGTFVLGFSGLALNNGTEVIGWIRVDNPITAPTLASGIVSLGVDTGSAPTGLPQSGSSTLVESSDRRVLSAVYRKNQIWMTSTTMPAAGANANDATAFWVRIDATDTVAPALGELGYTGAEDLGSNTFTAYGSVAVNSGGHALFGFAASSAAIHPGAYFSSRAPEDPPGTTGATKLLEAGTDSYIRTFGGGRNRWGDYSGAAVDPLDGCFWIYNEHAMTRGTPTTNPDEDGRWATSFGRFCPWIFGDDFERGDTFRWSSTTP